MDNRCKTEQECQWEPHCRIAGRCMKEAQDAERLASQSAAEELPPIAHMPVATMVALDDGLGTVFLEFLQERPPAGTNLYAAPPSTVLEVLEPSLSDLDALARIYASNYASPHHFTLSVKLLRNLIAALREKA